MPFQIALDSLPGGYTLSAALPGETVSVALTEFTSSEDGDLFIGRLEGLPAHLVGKLPIESNIRPGTIDHLLAVILPDRSATVYVNELRVIGQMRAKRPIKAGEPIHQDDVADIAEISFDGVDIPPTAGVMFLFSVGWRKGLFYDLGPLHARGSRQFDLRVFLAQAYTYLTFQHLFKITAEEWSVLLDQGWFPFQLLKTGTVKEMLAHVRQKWPIDRLLERIADETRASFEQLRDRIASSPMLSEQLPFIDLAIEHFRKSDYISSIAVLYPRLEGIMRRQHLQTQPQKRPSQGNLASGLVEADAKSRHQLSLLLPERFREFLTSVYFKDFDPRNPEGISRHTVSHGVAPAVDYDLKGATLGFLALDQMSYFVAA
jgi:hypothetical protein